MSECQRANLGDTVGPATFTQRFGEIDLVLESPPGVWNPTPHGIALGNALVELDFTGARVLELGTGCGVHAILLARRGAAQLTLTEIAPEALESARRNCAAHGVAIPIEYTIADWTRVSGAPFDALVANPPFAKAGMRYRRYFIDTLILDAPALVRPGGRLIFVQSSMADIPRTLRLLDEHGMATRIVRETDGPFREYYFDDPAFMRESARVVGGYSIRDGTHYERLAVIEAVLPAD